MRSGEAKDGLVLASYNVHECVGRDGRRDVARVARVIERLDADVVALQEVESRAPRPGEPPQVELLGHLVGLEAVSGPTMERRDSHFGNVILTRLPVRAVRKLNLTFRTREPRAALDVDLDARGTPLRVIATHLGLLPSERRYQVQRILEAVSKDRSGLVVLMGDINEWLMWGRPLRWLHTHFGFCKAEPTYPASFPLFALDRIWVHPSEAVRCFAPHVTLESRSASDHLPVRAEVALGPSSR